MHDSEQAVATTVDDQPESSLPCADEPLELRIEALLIAAERPMTDSRLAALLGLETKGAAERVNEAIADLNRQYQQSPRSFRIEHLAGGWQFLTTAVFGPLVARMVTERQQTRLSQPALETLAIIAYRQPIMRAEIEAIRGVACGEVLRGLLDRRLVRIAGRAEELGRPMLYGTTQAFLRVFGLASPDDLPAIQGLGEPARTSGTSDTPEAAES